MWPRRRQKSILPDLFFSKFFLIFCVALFLAILFGLANGTVKNYKVDSEIGDLQGEIKSLEGQNQDFSQMINFLKSENFIEQEAKLKLGLSKPGEKLVIIPQSGNAINTNQNKESANLPNPSKWWAYFFINNANLK